MFSQLLLRTLGLIVIGLPLVCSRNDPSSLLNGDPLLAKTTSTNATGAFLDTLSKNQRQLFEYAMNGLDANFGPPFLFGSPRYSAWYAVGLLARNQGNDAKLASQIIQDVISCQFKDPSKLWFGTFKDTIDVPDPGPVYAPLIYFAYDPNQGLFVCTSWIIIMEEFQHLLEKPVVELMKMSMYNATIGEGYRVGGVNGDNLFPVYSNPWYMRVMAATYVGHMHGDANMTFWGDNWARMAIAEFDRYGTLSEFNSGTYSGVTLYALSLWGYMPKDSVIASHAPGIIKQIWMSLGEYYNPTLRTLGGPWDRSYGFDMKSYFAILGAQITGLVGGLNDGTAPMPLPLVGSEHYADAAAIALTPLVAKFHDHLVPESVCNKLIQLAGDGHQHFAQAVSPPFDNLMVPRNYTSWTGIGLSVGGIQIDERSVGGPALSPEDFVPAMILWSVGGQNKIAWIVHHATSNSISAVATQHNLTISYPPSQAFPSNSTSSNLMTFLISGFRDFQLQSNFLENGTAELPGLRLNVSGNVPEKSTRSLGYGTMTVNDLLFYTLTYMIPEDMEETPEIVFSFEKL